MHYFISTLEKNKPGKEIYKAKDSGERFNFHTMINEDPMEKMLLEERLKGENHRYILLEDSFKKSE